MSESSSHAASGETFECPVCARPIALKNGGSAQELASIVDKHIERCLRRKEPKSFASASGDESDSGAEGGAWQSGGAWVKKEQTSDSDDDVADGSRVGSKRRIVKDSRKAGGRLKRRSGDRVVGPRSAATSSSEDVDFPAGGVSFDMSDVLDDEDEVAGVLFDLEDEDDFAGGSDSDVGGAAAAAGAAVAGSAARGDIGTAAPNQKMKRFNMVDDWKQRVFTRRLDTYLDAQASRPPAESAASATTAGQFDDGSPIANSNRMCNSIAGKICDDTWNGTMYEYQREGVRWLYHLYSQGTGGILGDEMGLGKTIQVCVHFAIVSSECSVTPVPSAPFAVDCPIFLVICPVTVLHHWLNEFHKWVPFMRVLTLHIMSANFAETLSECGGRKGLMGVLKRMRRDPLNFRGIVVIASYDALRRYGKDVLLEMSGGWNGVAIDEGQKIRNPNAEISMICKLLPSYHRIIMSGTPIQNSLKELWSLFDFIYPNLLGSNDTFDKEFATPIRMGNYKNSSPFVKEIAIRTAFTLQRIISPYLLRRKKDNLAIIAQLPKKTEHVLFCRLTPVQRRAYTAFLNTTEVQQVLQRKYPAFSAITTLRKICNHPSLAHFVGKMKWESVRRPVRGGVPDSGGSSTTAQLDQSSTSTTCNGELMDWIDSGKLIILGKVLRLWYAEGHKILIFTQTQSMLSLVEGLLRNLATSTPGTANGGPQYVRLDGSTPVSKRESLISHFNSQPSVFAMILTTRTGGVGISLTAANRVIIIDPDWNPQTDIQARERAWRIGQSREVTIYRLITRGTIEEAIYKRQIFKLLLTSRILDNPKQKALFAKSELSDLFKLTDNGGSSDGFGDASSNSNVRGYRGGRFGAGSSSSSALFQPRNELTEGAEYTVVYNKVTKPDGSIGYTTTVTVGDDSDECVLDDLPKEGKVDLSAGVSSSSSSLSPSFAGTAQNGAPRGIAMVQGAELEEGEEAAVDPSQGAANPTFTFDNDGIDPAIGIDELELFQDPTSLLMNNPRQVSDNDLRAIETMFSVESGALAAAQPAEEEEEDAAAGAGAQNEGDRDKQLLRALLDGEDIEAVYDHSFAEVTNSAAPKAGLGYGGNASQQQQQHRNPAAVQRVRAAARSIVDRKLSSFTSDAMEDFHSNPQQTTSSTQRRSYAASSSSTNNNSSRSWYGGSAADGSDDDLDRDATLREGQPTSSAAMLAGIRKRFGGTSGKGGPLGVSGDSSNAYTSVDVGNSRSSPSLRSSPVSAPSPVLGASSSSTSSSPIHSRASIGNASSSGGDGNTFSANKRPVKDTMMTKLIKILKSHQSEYEAFGVGSVGMSSEELLSHFRFLEDSNAPLFRSILQRVAVFVQEAHGWVLRDKYNA